MLIGFIEDKDNTETWRGYAYGVSMFVVALVQSICLQQYFHFVTVLGMKIRTAVIGMVYSKVQYHLRVLQHYTRLTRVQFPRTTRAKHAYHTLPHTNAFKQKLRA